MGFSYEVSGLPELVIGGHLDGYIIHVEFVTYPGSPLASSSERDAMIDELRARYVFEEDELAALRDYWLSLYPR